MRARTIHDTSAAAPVSPRRNRSWHRILGPLGGWTGAIVLVFTLLAAIGLFAVRDYLSSLGQLGYLGVAVVAFVGNAPIVPVFPWLALVAPMSGLYPTGALVAVGALGAGLGESVPYLFGYQLSRAHSRHRWVRRLVALPIWARLSIVFVLSLSPVLSFPGLASGVIRVPLWAMAFMKITTEALKLWIVLEAVIAAHRVLAG